jgi:DNA polymerase III subunit epsilon
VEQAVGIHGSSLPVSAFQTDNHPMTDPRPIAFVDLETTGSTAGRDRITEIGIVELWEGEVRRWSQLVNPGTRIPSFIAALTGITDVMVQDQPSFQEVAAEILDRLHGKLFVAHNARFDYGFLRAEFKACGIAWHAPVLCTVKLSRRLFPQETRHNLDSLIQRHGLSVSHRHRALGDADVLHQFWQVLQQEIPAQVLDKTITDLLGRTALPPQIDTNQIDRIPDSPGVYLFHDAKQTPLYIGKSKTLRTRVLSHFSAALSRPKEMRLSQQVASVEFIETAGEVGALLLESRLIKEKLPIHNVKLRRSRELFVWQAELPGDLQAPLVPQLLTGVDLDHGLQNHLFGPFRTRRDAINLLESLARQHGLCRRVLGLEKGASGKACFAHQIGQCAGACVAKQRLAQHNLTLITALGAYRMSRWPYSGPMGLREGEEVHVLHDWRHLGTAKSEAEIHDLLESGQPAFDMDTYKILKQALTRARHGQLFSLGIPLKRASAGTDIA